MNPAQLREWLKPTVDSYPHPPAALLPSLHALVDIGESIDGETQAVLAEMCGVEAASVDALLRRYPALRKRAPSSDALCFGTICYLRGAPEIYEQLLQAPAGNGNGSRAGGVTTSPCLGHCYAAPVLRGSDGLLHQVTLTESEG